MGVRHREAETGTRRGGWAGAGGRGGGTLGTALVPRSLVASPLPPSPLLSSPQRLLHGHHAPRHQPRRDGAAAPGAARATGQLCVGGAAHRGAAAAGPCFTPARCHCRPPCRRRGRLPCSTARAHLAPFPTPPAPAPPPRQASFEETNDILFRAAQYSERDAMAGVSENILMGQLCPVGTGAFSLLIDEDKLAGGWAGAAAAGAPGLLPLPPLACRGRRRLVQARGTARRRRCTAPPASAFTAAAPSHRPPANHRCRRH